jgi:hypothetical protein
MTRDEFKEKLATAGKTYDGHVTHGSIEAQMKVVDELLAEQRPGPAKDQWILEKKESEHETA